MRVWERLELIIVHLATVRRRRSRKGHKIELFAKQIRSALHCESLLPRQAKRIPFWVSFLFRENCQRLELEIVHVERFAVGGVARDIK